MSISEPAPDRALREGLTSRDWRFFAICAVLAAASLLLVLRYFSSAFPEASIEFRYDRSSSQAIAAGVLTEQKLSTARMKHAASFEADDGAKTFLERSLGLDRASALMRRDVHLWYWHHRWFRPLQEEEFAVDVAPTGEVISFFYKVPEDRALPAAGMEAARAAAERFLTHHAGGLADLQIVAQSERKLPHRLQRIFTWDSKSVRPAGAPYRHEVTVDGDRVTGYSQRIKVPDEWQRGYQDLRSKNFAAGNVDFVFLVATMIAALIVFVIRLRRGDLQLRFLLGIGIVSVVLVGGVALNSFPSALASYETTDSYPAFILLRIFGALMQSFGTAVLLIVIAGAGEALYRERMPGQLSIGRVFRMRALGSKRVFRSFVLGYALVAFFLAYQVAFYLIAGRFGAWAPAEIPYDAMLNTAFPWIAVLFAGFFPALSEEFLSRAFSIPLFERIFRSRIAAIVLAGFIWGFGHTTYPNQPFYIRGVEVGIAGVVLGFVLMRFGLLPLLVWHYTVDAVYTALLLFRSHNLYYMASAGLASLVFAIPMLISIAMYFRNGGFLPDEDLSNAAAGSTPRQEPVGPRPVERTPLPPAIGITPVRAIVCVLIILVAVVLLAFRPRSPNEAIDYATTREQAKAIARGYVTGVAHLKLPARCVAAPVEGFRSWDASSQREDGGSPGGFDGVAATYLLRHGMPMKRLIEVFRNEVKAATWNVRLFTPSKKEEIFIEVDPRARRVAGFHRYQDEGAPGPRLEQAAALDIARPAFAGYGANAADFDLKEALSFQQPNRRDWLFHFQQRTPLAAEGYRRVSVRVAGAEVTQFTTTVKVPDSVYREEEQRTIVNTLLFILKTVAALAIVALAVTGFILATRKGHFPWRRPLKGTALLAIAPILMIAADYESILFSYGTSVQWDTFVFTQAVKVLFSLALQLGLIFLALAGIEAAYPFAPDLRRREARARFGRAAALAALSAVALFAVARTVLSLVKQAFPSAASVQALAISDNVAIPLPAALAIAEALMTALALSAIVGLVVTALRAVRGTWWIPPLTSTLLVALVSLDAGATPRQMPFMLFSAVLWSVLAIVAVRYVLGDNVMAYPLAAITAVAISAAAGMMHNHRVDLQVNGVALIAIVAAMYAWVVTAQPRVEEQTGVEGRSS